MAVHTLTGVCFPQQTDSMSLSSAGESLRRDPERVEDGGAALEVSFEMESSCYATVLLRELMRSEDT